MNGPFLWAKEGAGETEKQKAFIRILMWTIIVTISSACLPLYGKCINDRLPWLTVA